MPERYWDIGLNLSDPEIGVLQSWSKSMGEQEIRDLYGSRGFSMEEVGQMMEDTKRRDTRVKYPKPKPRVPNMYQSSVYWAFFDL